MLIKLWLVETWRTYLIFDTWGILFLDRLFHAEYAQSPFKLILPFCTQTGRTWVVPSNCCEFQVATPTGQMSPQQSLVIPTHTSLHLLFYPPPPPPPDSIHWLPHTVRIRSRSTIYLQRITSVELTLHGPNIKILALYILHKTKNLMNSFGLCRTNIWQPEVLICQETA